MAAQSPNQILNRLVINLGRSLLQYLGEAWPWTSGADDAKLETLEELVARQQDAVNKIVDLLIERHWLIEFGTYPTEYTDLQYLSLDYLLTQTLENAEADAKLIASAREQIDDEAAAVLDEVGKTQNEIVDALRELARPTPGDQAA